MILSYCFLKYILIFLLPLKDGGGATSMDQPPLVKPQFCGLHVPVFTLNVTNQKQ